MDTASIWRASGGADGDSRRVLATIALAVVLAAVPGTALAGSAVDVYSPEVPNAKGNVESPETAPVAQPSDLPPTVANRLAHDRQGKTLATIATAGELGAPPPAGAARLTNVDVAGDDPSSGGTLLGSLDDPAAIGMLLALVLIVGGFAYTAARRRTNS